MVRQQQQELVTQVQQEAHQHPSYGCTGRLPVGWPAHPWLVTGPLLSRIPWAVPSGQAAGVLAHSGQPRTQVRSLRARWCKVAAVVCHATAAACVASVSATRAWWKPQTTGRRHSKDQHLSPRRNVHCTCLPLLLLQEPGCSSFKAASIAGGCACHGAGMGAPAARSCGAE